MDLTPALTTYEGTSWSLTAQINIPNPPHQRSCSFVLGHQPDVCLRLCYSKQRRRQPPPTPPFTALLNWALRLVLLRLSLATVPRKRCWVLGAALTSCLCLSVRPVIQLRTVTSDMLMSSGTELFLHPRDHRVTGIEFCWHETCKGKLQGFTVSISPRVAALNGKCYFNSSVLH